MLNSKGIKLAKRFRKNLDRRFEGNRSAERLIKERIKLFLLDRTNPLVNDHRLLGRLSNYRSFSITGDIRIIYMEYEEYYLFMDIGTHNQIYK